MRVSLVHTDAILAELGELRTDTLISGWSVLAAKVDPFSSSGCRTCLTRNVPTLTDICVTTTLELGVFEWKC